MSTSVAGTELASPPFDTELFREAPATGPATPAICERYPRCALHCSAGKIRVRSHRSLLSGACCTNKIRALIEAIYSPADRAREIYKAATQEKLALIRFWHQEIRKFVEMTDEDRKERTEWLQSSNLLRDKLQDDLQVSARLSLRSFRIDIPG